MASPRGAPAIILLSVLRGRLQLVVFREILDEYHRLLSNPSVVALFRRHGVSLRELETTLKDIAAASELVEPGGKAPPCRDPQDRIYLHCAVEGGAGWLVTRDGDLLAERGNVDPVSIVTPEEFLACMAGSGLMNDP